MRKPERDTMSPEVERDLATIDAALAGEPGAAEEAPLAELALVLRALRPQPREEFRDTLDGRAAAGFKGGGRSGHRRAGGGWRPKLSQPAFALAVVLLVIVGVTVPLALSGGGSALRSAPPADGGAMRVPEGSASSSAAAGHHALKAEGAAGAARAAGPIGEAQITTPGARRVEQSAALDLGVSPSAIQSTSRRVFTVVNGFGGYVQQSNVTSGDAEQAGATFELKVPSAKLGSAIAALSQLGHVRSENDTTNDVTGQYESLQRSLGDAQAERASLLRQLAAATEAQQAEALKGKLHGVEGHIAQLQGELRALNGRIDYTSVSLTLTPESSGAGAGSLTPGGAARDAAQILDAAVAVVVLASAAVLPVAVIALLIWVLVAASRRRLREGALDA